MVTFQNGDSVTIGKLSPLALEIATLPILFVMDKDGNIIGVIGSSEVTAQHEGGGATVDGGYTTLVLPDGVTICYGECPVRPGVITITNTNK